MKQLDKQTAQHIGELINNLMVSEDMAVVTLEQGEFDMCRYYHLKVAECLVGLSDYGIIPCKPNLDRAIKKLDKQKRLKQ